MELEKSFFARDTEKVAKDLLGCKVEKDGMRGKIVETEAYTGDDPACHAHPNKTERNRLLYETYGHIYIYLCYGIHHMMNFTTEKNGVGGVLIRALEPVEGIEKMRKNRRVEEVEKLCSGPGKICEATNITRELKGTSIGEKIRVEKGGTPEFKASTRIGISKAKDLKRRFYVKENPHVSQR